MKRNLICALLGFYAV